MNILQFVGAATGIVGTWILSSKLAAQSRWRFWAFSLYAVSNVAMIGIGVWKGVWSLILMQSVYMLFTINGLRNNRP